MRFLLPSLLFVAACAETVPAPPPPPVNWASLKPLPPPAVAPRIAATEKERAAANLYLKALASPGTAQLASVLDEEAHFKFAAAKDIHGREAIIKAHDALIGGFDDRVFTATRVLITESSQSLEWTMTGTQATTHKPVSIRGVTLLWTKDVGSISDEHLYFDEAIVKAQLGTGPQGLVSFKIPPPSGKATIVEQARTPEEAANAALVRGVLDAFEDDKEPAYLGPMAEDIEVHTLEKPDPTRGRAAQQGYFKTMHAAIAYLSTSIENAWGIGPYVVVEYHIIGEQRRPIGWIPLQKDTLIRMPVVDVAEIRGGKIARVWRYDDPMQVVK
jgi:hypothetical protein